MTDLYIVEQRHPSGNYLAETNIVDATAEITVRDLMHAQFDDKAVRVFKLVDVTAEFRAKLQGEINKSPDGRTPDWLFNFMAE